MNEVVICGRQAALHREYSAVGTLEIEGIPVTVGCIETKKPVFNEFASENKFQVLVKVRAFSCNYSDKSLILTLSQKCGDGASYSCIGSEFVGEILAIGRGVSRFQVGDRVVADNQFPADDVSNQPGIPTNYASRRYLSLHEAKLIKVPPEMSDEVAATFSVNAQTTYSILRKLDIQAGKSLLLTSATSSTSLFALQTLRRYNVSIYSLTTTISDWNKQRLLEMGVKEVIPVTSNLFNLREQRQIEGIVARIGGFNYVIDPFFDLNLSRVLYTIAAEGKYITYGRADTYSQFTGKRFLPENRSLQEVMLYTSSNNIQILGNVLGQTQDLDEAMKDYLLGFLNVIIDSVFRGNQVVAFFDRIYNAHDRFGKVAYCYTD